MDERCAHFKLDGTWMQEHCVGANGSNIARRLARRKGSLLVYDEQLIERGAALFHILATEFQDGVGLVRRGKFVLSHATNREQAAYEKYNGVKLHLGHV